MKKTEIKRKLSSTKAAIYIRVSTANQIDKDSLPMQRDDLIYYCKYALNIENNEVFEDAGFSAKNTDRPAFQEMMSRVRIGEFSHVVVWKIDRISRNLLDFSMMYKEFKTLGVVFVSKNEQFDTSTAMGEAMLKIILVFAELERNMTSERVKATMLSKANKGEWNGGRVCYGYDYNDETKEFSINKAEAEIVKKIFYEYESKQSLLTISRDLNAKNIFTRSQKPWSPVTLSIILKNPFYTGVYRYNYRADTNGKKKSENDWILKENHHPQIIDKETWLKVISILKNNRRSSRNNKTYLRKHVHIFAGILKCGLCGSNMPSTIDKERSNGYRPSIYICSRRRRFNDCDNKYISDVVLGPFVINYIANIIKAQNNFGKSTSIETFEKKLLRGDFFADIEGIEYVGLKEMYDMLKTSTDLANDNIFTKLPSNSENKAMASETDLLLAEKRKKERAASRLQSLFLYSDDAISERDYLIQKNEITTALEEIDSKLEQREKTNTAKFSMSDKDFIEKASYFIITQNLNKKRYIVFETLIQSVDSQIIKDFINSIIQKIVILDGHVASIRFKNGIEHKFLYENI